MKKRFTRKLALSPLQNRIFWALADCGETFHQLLIEVSQSTLYPGTPLPPNAQAPFELVRAIEGLKRIGFVVIECAEVGDTRELLQKAASSVHWDGSDERWIVKPGTEHALKLEIVLTAAAHSAYGASN